MTSAIPLIGGIPAGPELLIILLVLVLLFGANKIPKLARSTGQAMGEFKKGREEVEEELQKMQEGDLDTDTTTETSAEPPTEATAETSTETTTDDDLETETETEKESSA
jgi:sec-independent protein translocase protein TatA